MTQSTFLTGWLNSGVQLWTGGEAAGSCFLQEEIVKMPRVRGGIQPAGSHTGFPSGREGFPVSGWSKLAR